MYLLVCVCFVVPFFALVLISGSLSYIINSVLYKCD